MSQEPSLREKAYNAVGLLLDRKASVEEEEWLTGLLESLYRLADEPQSLSELRDWLLENASRSSLVRLWVPLVRLAESETGGSWRRELADLDHLLPAPNSWADTFLRTQAAREVLRLTGDPAIASARLRGQPIPNPRLQETAVEAVRLRLHLAAINGEWQEHARLAAGIQANWLESAGPQAGWVQVVLAEHAIQRGQYTKALDLLHTAKDGGDERLRLSLLGTQLHALLASGGGLKESPLKAEVEGVSRLLEPMLAGGLPSDDEGRERFRRYSLLLHRAQRKGPNQGIASQEELEAALLSGTARRNPEAMLKHQLQWVRRQLEQKGAQVVDICEPLVRSVIEQAEAQGLRVLQMMGWYLLASIKAHLDPLPDLNSASEALSAAGRAANLGVEILKENLGSAIERSLRADLVTVFDQAVELLAALAVSKTVKMTSQQRDAFGRALLDYVEQVAELALSEARQHIRTGGKTLGAQVVSNRIPRTADLQAALRPREGVLQYFLVARYLIILAYGRNFLAWKIQDEFDLASDNPQQRDNPQRSPAYFEPLLGIRRVVGMSRRKRAWAYREVELTGAVEPDEVILQKLADLLLPESIRTALENHQVKHLAIVPHDILYRTPFGSLPWKRSYVGTRFILSLHPTGGLASSHPAKGWSPGGARMSVGFFKGPDLQFADAERKELRRALGRDTKVFFVNTLKRINAFLRKAPEYDALYLACHGKGGASGGEAWLALGPKPARVRLSEVAALNLGRCGLAVLQSCWTGWMNHSRELPVQGFPQALRDAGVAAVVAPMFRVSDPLCPVFAAVFGRLLRIFPVCQALSKTLKILRRHNAILGADPSTWSYRGMAGVFDSYEYRFTGDPDLRLHGGLKSRMAARIDLALWIMGRTALSFYWPISHELRILLSSASNR